MSVIHVYVGLYSWKCLTAVNDFSYRHLTISVTVIANNALVYGVWVHLYRFRNVSKGDNFRNFLFANLADENFPKWGLLLKKRICSDGSKFFPL